MSTCPPSQNQRTMNATYQSRDRKDLRPIREATSSTLRAFGRSCLFAKTRSKSGSCLSKSHIVFAKSQLQKQNSGEGQNAT